jgi:uncharacterized protein (DUF736 family)
MSENTAQKEKENKNKNIEVGALWKRRANSTGKLYLAGYVKHGEVENETTQKVVVFSNSYKDNEKAPDYRIYLSKPQDATQEGSKEEESQQETQETKEEMEELI